MLRKRANEALIKAIKKNDGEGVLDALSEGAQIERMQDGATPLILAAEEGCESAALALIEAGADFRARDISGGTALHWFAAANKSKKVVEVLLNAGAPIDARDGDGGTPLTSAVILKNKEIVSLLIDRGAGVNIPDHLGMTPLHYAAETYSEGIPTLLIKAGAKIDAQDFNGDSPLTMACSDALAEITAIMEMKELSEVAAQPQASAGRRRI